MAFFTDPSAATCSCDSAAFSALEKRVAWNQGSILLLSIILLFMAHSILREILKRIRQIEEEIDRRSP